MCDNNLRQILRSLYMYIDCTLINLLDLHSAPKTYFAKHTRDSN